MNFTDLLNLMHALPWSTILTVASAGLHAFSAKTIAYKAGDVLDQATKTMNAQQQPKND